MKTVRRILLSTTVCPALQYFTLLWVRISGRGLWNLKWVFRFSHQLCLKYRVNTKTLLDSSTYKIKTYWNIFYKYGTAGTLTQEIFNFPARLQRAVKCSIPVSFYFNPLNAELNPISYLLALLAHHFLHVSRIRVKSLTLKLLMSHIWSTYS